ncbi:hypothetical protein B0H11DRAFT_2255098 [Mycena galericulata]|nr:hypothetical protein B0H11DRAFT_2255098 [Mycena galericulata]
MSLNLHSHAKVPTEKLMLSDEQRHAIETIYGSEQELSLKYFPGNVESQKDAQQLLALHQLDIISRKQLENRWSIQWSTAWPSGERLVSGLCSSAPLVITAKHVKR